MIPVLNFMTPILAIIALVLLIWYWMDGRRAHEAAVRVCKRACEQADLQLLDDTISLNRIKLRRDANGRMKFRRGYRFEYTNDSAERRQGHIVLHGLKVEQIHILDQTMLF